MPQLLESTRNYLRSSTKIGRRLSSYRDESSASEASLASLPQTPSKDILVLPEDAPLQKHRRLSTLFSLEGRKRPSVSSDDQPQRLASLKQSRRMESSLSRDQDDLHHDTKKSKKHKKSSSISTSNSLPVPPSPSLHYDNNRSTASMDYSNAPMPVEQLVQGEEEDDQVVPPRGCSPTLTINTLTSATSYTTRPSDYPSMKQYQQHVWRRTLLEESIMLSLGLGYAERPSTSSSHRRSSSRSLKRESHAATMAALEADHGEGVDATVPQGVEEVVTVLDRGLAPPAMPHQGKPKRTTKSATLSHPRSPYQMMANASTSTTNITHSFTSFTLELPEHQAHHIISASRVPNLFTVKAMSMRIVSGRSRKDSTASSRLMPPSGHNMSPSPRVLGNQPMSKTYSLDKPMPALPAVVVTEESKENVDPQAVVA
ncbi:hypothetical protein BGW38_003109 [Lunasporangiospora selenospora]|uniref:Uncharacterized protein n=1 Tax=Lunasporangiospora selenospora TaxID=979761 RepID=A0A9P6KD28_9FUNG|nr:hypothetical protein BGW38_003109 [Lunasporangiospora selenospora]